MMCLLDNRSIIPPSGLPALAAWLMAAVFVLFSACFVLGHYQTHSGDMGQYITHARNLMWGRSWEVYMLDFPAVLPGYPLFIAIPLVTVGLNMFLFGLLNSLLWALCCVVFYTLYRERLCAYSGWVFLAVLLFNPFVVYFQQEMQPNLFYSASCAVALYAAYRLRDLQWKASPATLAGWALLVLLPATIRQDSLALYMALALYYIFLDRKLVLLAVCGIALTIGLDLLITSFGQFSNISVLFFVGMKYTASSATSEHAFVPSVLFMF
ncbi:MAG: hypothetical protein ACPG80_05970, partial [Rickettsiales bacterium]